VLIGASDHVENEIRNPNVEIRNKRQKAKI